MLALQVGGSSRVLGSCWRLRSIEIVAVGGITCVSRAIRLESRVLPGKPRSCRPLIRLQVIDRR
jgi:hypothetical protein